MGENRTTWDGAPVSPEPPHGATIVVYTERGRQRLYLLLHRGLMEPDDEGDWAWTPPSGARLPGEPVVDCARRELLEETGLALDILETGCGTEAWRVYAAQAGVDAEVRLSLEHDRAMWADAQTAARMCRPAVVGAQVTCVDAWLKE